MQKGKTMASTLVAEAKLGDTTSGRRYLYEAGEQGKDKLRKVYDEVSQEFDEVTNCHEQQRYFK